jgi:hypothetical protein
MSVPSIGRLRARIEAVAASAGFAMVASRRTDDEPGVVIAGPTPRLEGAPRPANLLTMLSAVRPGGPALIRRFFDAVRCIPKIQKPLLDLALIRAAHWTVVDKLHDGHGKWEPLHPPYLLFESTFDLDLDSYIALFSEHLPWQMRAVWSTSYGYPGVVPSSAFTRWVRAHSYDPADHVFRAYPEATTRMVCSGLRVAKRLRVFGASVAGCDADEFAFELRRLLVELQDDLS